MFWLIPSFAIYLVAFGLLVGPLIDAINEGGGLRGFLAAYSILFLIWAVSIAVPAIVLRWSH